MKKNKVGVIKCGNSCANCKNSCFNNCKLHNIFIYPGAICDDYEEDDKKIKRNFKKTEYANKNWTNRYFCSGKEMPAVPIGDLLQLIPKAVANRIKESLYANNLSEEILVRADWYYVERVFSNGTCNNISNLFDYKDVQKIKTAYTEFVYENIAPMITEDED